MLSGELLGGQVLSGEVQKVTIKGAGTDNYNELQNKPQINGVELVGNKTTEDLGIVSEESDPTVPQHVKDIKQEDINAWNNKAEQSDIENVESKIPTKVSALENDAGYLNEVPSEYITETELDNKGYATTEEVENAVKDKATMSYVNEKIADLVNSAPEALDTLGEVANAIRENESVVDALNSAIGNKANQSDLDETNSSVDELKTAVEDKADKSYVEAEVENLKGQIFKPDATQLEDGSYSLSFYLGE